MNRFRAAIAILCSCSLLLAAPFLACGRGAVVEDDVADATAADARARRFGVGMPIPTPGDAGQVLVSNGAGVTPSWQQTPSPLNAPDACPEFIVNGPQGGGQYGGIVTADPQCVPVFGDQTSGNGSGTGAAIVGTNTTGAVQGGPIYLTPGSGDGGFGNVELDYGGYPSSPGNWWVHFNGGTAGGVGVGVESWSAAATATLQQQPETVDIAPGPMTLQPSPPMADAGTHVVGGDLVVDLATPNTGTTRSHVDVQEQAGGLAGTTTKYAAIGRDMTNTCGAVYLGNGLTPSTTNATLFCDTSANSYVSAPSGSCVDLTIGESTASPVASFCGSTITFNQTVGGPGFHGQFIQRTVVTSTETFTTNASTNSVIVRLLGGGGSGGGCPAVSGDNGAGGGSGAYSEWAVAASPSTGYSVTVGAVVTGTSNAAGTNGNQSSITIGTTCTAPGGGGGAKGSVGLVAGGAGGVAGTGCTLSVPGNAGGNGSNGNALGNGSPSVLGGGVAAAIAAGAGTNGGNYGAGGSGCLTTGSAAAGGSSAAGVVIIDEFK